MKSVVYGPFAKIIPLVKMKMQKHSGRVESDSFKVV